MFQEEFKGDESSSGSTQATEEDVNFSQNRFMKPEDSAMAGEAFGFEAFDKDF